MAPKTIMEQVIAYATNVIHGILESSSKPCSDTMRFQLITICNDLNQLLQLTSLNDHWIRLFCRQLKRSLNYNLLSTDDSWAALHKDILYLLNRSNHGQYEGNDRNNFFAAIQLETKLEQREIKFQKIFQRGKSFNEFFSKHRVFFEEYLHKCISFHSKLQMQGLVQNIDDLLRNVYGLTDFFLNSEDQRNLKEKLNVVQISLDASTSSFSRLHLPSVKYDESPRIVNNTLSRFIPSAEKLQLEKCNETLKINAILEYYRWLVILGDPGSGKTTLLRWITSISAEKVYSCSMRICLEAVKSDSIRIPILIRIGEFSEWLDCHPTNTLIDYIGKHTWFTKQYCCHDDENVLKELIYHGHALILLDGIDEISNLKRRGEIVELIRNFIDEYTRTPSFISAFDENTINIRAPYNWTDEIYEVNSSIVPAANQILITSRIVGYHLHSLFNPLIVHFSILPMNDNDTKEFTRNLTSKIANSIFDILQKDIPDMLRYSLKALWQNRFDAITKIFENCSEILTSTPFMLSSICTYIFQSSNEFHFKSRIEVYHYVIQSTLYSWINKKPDMSEHILSKVLIDLAVYLHLQSSSGLIDAFDLECLCCSTINRLSVFNNRAKLRNYAKKFISLLDASVGIVAERDLQVFGFSHLTFQEYFVAQSLVGEQSSIENVTERILTYIIRPRFRESLILALSWISWKWTMNDYTEFCNLLVRSVRYFAIPFGALLFFDAFHDLQRLPSNSVIFNALNSILDNSFDSFSVTYFMPSLFKLHENVIKEWMQQCLKDEKRICKFCCCFLAKNIECDKSTKVVNLESKTSTIYQQLCSLYNLNTSAEFVIDQTLRSMVLSSKISPDNIFTNEVFSIHPLLMSVLIASCGGVYLENKNDIAKLIFSPEKIHRQSSIIAPIVDYINNPNELHTIKIQILIKQYEDTLENATLSDTSVDIIDTFVALLCLQGVSEPLIYEKYYEYQALSIAVDRLKRLWFYLEKLLNAESRLNEQTKSSFMIFEIESMMNEFFSKLNQSDEQCINFSLACATALNRLHSDLTLNWIHFDIFRTKNLDRYLEYQPEFFHPNLKRQVEQIMQNIHPFQLLQHEPHFLLAFTQHPLQPLYYCLIIHPANNTNSFPSLAVLLSHCLAVLDRVQSYYNINFYLAVFVLLPQLKKYLFENYALLLLEQGKSVRWPNEARNEFLKIMKDCTFINQPIDWERLIDVERQRIREAKNEIPSHEKDLCLFSASICLGRLQKQHYSYTYEMKNETQLRAESEDIRFGIMNIVNPVLRMIALSIVLNMKYPFIFDEEQRDKMILETMDLIEPLLPNIPLLILTLLFVQCNKFLQAFPISLQHIIHVIGKKLNENSIHEQTEEQEAVFIALKQFSHLDLSYYLAKFARRTKNLSNFLHFNSKIFNEYFDIKGSFNEPDTVLPTVMYLIELAFDAQILKLFIKNNQKIEISPKQQLEQLWKDSSKYSKIMTLKVARWITNYLEKLTDKTDLQEIIQDTIGCLTVIKQALPIIEKWLKYRKNKDLQLFAYYAAFILVQEGLDNPNLFEIINEAFMNDHHFYLIPMVRNLFYLQPINYDYIRQIFILLNKNIRYSAQICVYLECKEILDLILTLELERVTSCFNANFTSKDISQSYVFMVCNCSEDLELYLKQYLLQFTNTNNNLPNHVQDMYLAIVFKWIFEMSIDLYRKTKFSMKLYEWIFTFLHNQQLFRVRKGILSALNAIFTHESPRYECIFIENDIINHLETIICSWNKYPESVLNLCLLTYGNYILKLKALQKSRIISEEIRNALTVLIKTSSIDLITVRAGFCLIYIHHSEIPSYTTILNWFETQSSIKSKHLYILELQMTMYDQLNQSWIKNEEIIVQFVDMFVLDIYTHLCNKETIDYLVDPTPNYFKIASNICEKHCKIFRNAIKNSSFGEENFRKAYVDYFYQTKNPTYRKDLVHLYAAFTGITHELLNMIKWIDSIEISDSIVVYNNRYAESGNPWKYLEPIKDIYDRDIIENLFQSMDSAWYDGKPNSFKSLVELFFRFAQNNIVSELELHEHISSLFSDLSLNNNQNTSFKDLTHILDLMLNLSCIRKLPVPDSKGKLFTEKDIDEKFENRIQSLRNESIFFLRRNYFITTFRSKSSHSK